MTRLEIASWCTVAALAALSTTAWAAPKKPKKPAAAPAASASAAPAASSAAPAPPPAPSAAPVPAAAGGDDEGTHEAATAEVDKKLSVGADLLFVLPVGKLSDLTGPQVGPLVRAGYRVIPQLEATARIGYLFAFGKTQPSGASTSITNLPIWLGARYFLQEAPAGLYGAAEVGMNFLTAMGPNFSNGDTRAGFNLGAGYVLSKELPIDVRLQFSYMNLIGTASNEPGLMGIGLSAGYSLFF